MANLTITVDEETLRRARTRALELGTTVNALLREALEEFVREDRVAEARRELVALARDNAAGGRLDGYRWTRDEIYEDHLQRPRS